MTRTEERVEDAIARARCVFPVPGGPCRSIPFGGFKPRYDAFVECVRDKVDEKVLPK